MSFSSIVHIGISVNIAAGYMPTKRIQRGEASKIMTGAAVPEWADAVVKVEETEGLATPNRVKILKSVRKGSNISCRGEDMQSGQVVLQKGTAVRPQEIGILAMVGKSSVEVFC